MSLVAFIDLFKRFVLRDLAHNKMRSLLTVAGIALGVSVFLAISIANSTALSRFGDTVAKVSGKANLEVAPAVGTVFDERVIRDIAPLTSIGVKYSPISDENVILLRPDGETEMVQLVGIDMLADPDFKTYQNQEADAKAEPVPGTDDGVAGKAASDVSVFSPATCLVGANLAQRLGISKGGEIKVYVDDRLVPLTVADVMDGGGLGGAYSGNLIIADIACAQEVLQNGGKVSRIDLICPPETLAQVETKLRASLPPDLRITSPEGRMEQAHKMTRSFEYNLLALTFIALMVGMFLIYNTMTITVLRRRPEIGTLRALGVAKTIVMRMFLLEALLLGLLGTTSGILVGRLMADGALRAVSKTFQQFYFKIPMESADPRPEQYLLAFAVGMGLTMIAAWPPLLEANSVSPAEATRRNSQESRLRRWQWPFLLGGVALLGVAYIFALQPAISGFPVFGYLAALLSIIGCASIVPFLLAHALPVLSRYLPAVFGVEGRLAATTLNGTLSRTSVAAASLMIGIAMMVSLAIMISSFRKTVTLWIDQSFQADLWMQSKAKAMGNKSGRLQGAVLDEVRKVPGVAAAEGFVERRLDIGGQQAFLAAADFDVLAEHGNQLFLSGRSNKEVCKQLVGYRAMISEPFAVRKNLKRGDSVTVATPQGDKSFVVEDIYYDYASDLGYVIIPRDVYKDLYGDDSVTSIAIYLEPDSVPRLDEVRKGILDRFKAGRHISIASTLELRSEAIRIFDRTFAITYALHTIAVTVALLSVMNALFALTLESKREFAILRYLGARKAQLSRVVLLQAAILGTVGNIGGLGLGYVLSLLLIYVINKQSFGWSVQYSIPVDFIVESGILVLVTAIASGIPPARLAARTLAPSVVRDE